ncbi:MAG: GerMN domain-containing protein [Christensenellales bacterium]|jgi:hypothetical protein
MKKSAAIISALLVLLLLVSCGDKKPDDQGPFDSPSADATPVLITPSPDASPSPDAAPGSAGDYLPFNGNVKYTYEGTGNEYASYTVFIDYIDGNRMQTRTNNGGSEIVRVLERGDDSVSVVYTRPEFYARENFLAQQGEPNALIKEPLEVGTSWQVKNGTREITSTNAAIEVPAGSFNAIEITETTDTGVTVEYYAKDTGLVKSVYNPGANEVVSELKSIEEGISLTQTVRFYYIGEDADKLYYTDKEVSFSTNDITKSVLEKAYKEVPSGVGRALPASAAIKSLYLNQDGAVYIDFTSGLIKDMNAGAGAEALILRGIANTFAGYYSTERVYLTVEGEPYSSGHIEMKKGEFIKADTSGIERLGS